MRTRKETNSLNLLGTVVSDLFRVSDILNGLVETDLLGNSFSSSSVFGTRLVLEDGIDFLEGQSLELGKSAMNYLLFHRIKLTSGRRKTEYRNPMIQNPMKTK
jgi:hypothetical protein